MKTTEDEDRHLQPPDKVQKIEASTQDNAKLPDKKFLKLILKNLEEQADGKVNASMLT